MTKIYSFRRLLQCFTAGSTSPAASTTATTKKRLSTSLRRLSTSLRDDIQDIKPHHHHQHHHRRSRSTRQGTTSSAATSRVRDHDASSTSSASSTSNESVSSHVAPRPSKSMVICTFFGHRRSHVWFCVQIDRLSSKPSLLLELSISTESLIKEMQSGLVRIALECDGSDLGPCPLHSVPVWSIYCNGRRIGFASRRKASDETRLMLKKMQSMTVGAGVIPSRSRSELEGPDQVGDVMYMRANYEWVVGGADSESYHLISPDDDCPGQDLSVFLLRSRK